MIKRAFDVVFSLLIMAALLPVYFVIAILIKLDSPGPIVYAAARAGRCGIPFRIFKFRTMRAGMEKPGGDTTALDDPRITRVGSFLRRFKLDELPQFLNVLFGDMSIVGPRPELLYYARKYDEKEKSILSVRPGITDYSSLEFNALDERVGSVDAARVFEEKFLRRKNELRLRYVREQSFRNDMSIILRTAAMLLGRLLKLRPRSQAPS